MRRTLLLTAVLLLVSALPLSAQVRLEGIVIDDATNQPIADARVDLIDGWGTLARRRMTDSLGHFRLPVRRLGTYRIRVRSPGYPEVIGVITTEAYFYHNLEIRLRQGARLLAPMTLLARAQMIPPAPLQGFHQRLRSGKGRFITREDVEALRPGYISDMIAWMPGVVVRRSGEDGEQRLLMNRQLLDNGRRTLECALRVYLDGEMVNPRNSSGEPAAVAIDQTVDQSMVDGIEIYTTPADVPAQFGGGSERCGVVAVWTHGRTWTRPTGMASGTGTGAAANPSNAPPEE